MSEDNTAVASPKTPLPKEAFVRPFVEDQNEGFTPPTFLATEEELEKVRPPKSVKTLEERINGLTDEQKEKLKEFGERVKAAEWYVEGDVNFDQWAQIRYLIARQWKLDKAFTMLENSAKWRKEQKPEETVCARCATEPNSHMMQFCGWDLEHRPVLYLSFRWAMNRRIPEEGLIHSLETFNHAVNLMPEGVEQWIAINDFVTYSHWNDGSPKQSSGVIKMMQDHFPERLRLQILIDPPTTFWVLWKCLSPFIDAKTKDKVRFWYTDQEPNIKDEFPKIFPPHLSDYLVATYTNNKVVKK